MSWKNTADGLYKIHDKSEAGYLHIFSFLLRMFQFAFVNLCTTLNDNIIFVSIVLVSLVLIISLVLVRRSYKNIDTKRSRYFMFGLTYVTIEHKH